MDNVQEETEEYDQDDYWITLPLTSPNDYIIDRKPSPSPPGAEDQQEGLLDIDMDMDMSMSMSMSMDDGIGMGMSMDTAAFSYRRLEEVFDIFPSSV